MGPFTRLYRLGRGTNRHARPFNDPCRDRICRDGREVCPIRAVPAARSRTEAPGATPGAETLGRRR